MVFCVHDHCINACSRLFLRYLRGSVSLLCTVLFSILLIAQVTAATDLRGEAAELNSVTLPLVVLVPPDVLAQYHAYLAGRSPLDIENFSGGGASRVLVELILLHQALVLGGCKRDIELQPVGDYRRMLALLNEGKADLRGTSVWREDVAVVPNGLLLSAPLFRDGEYEAGFYTSVGNKKALKTTSLHQLKRLSAVSNNNWTVDWRTLEAMGLSYLYHNGSYSAMVKMVFSERADFMLAPFSEGDDLTLKLNGLALEPIPGIKVALQGSRHWVASRRGAAAFDALGKGLAQLRTEGKLTKAFVEAGVFNPVVHEWEIVNR
jgi:hypothetical protein